MVALSQLSVYPTLYSLQSQQLQMGQSFEVSEAEIEETELDEGLVMALDPFAYDEYLRSLEKPHGELFAYVVCIGLFMLFAGYAFMGLDGAQLALLAGGH